MAELRMQPKRASECYRYNIQRGPTIRSYEIENTYRLNPGDFFQTTFSISLRLNLFSTVKFCWQQAGLSYMPDRHVCGKTSL